MLIQRKKALSIFMRRQYFKQTNAILWSYGSIFKITILTNYIGLTKACGKI